MAPCCWALLLTQLTLLLVGIAAANLTDWKFGLWWSILIGLEFLWNPWAAERDYQTVPLLIISLQMLVGAARGAYLLEGEHWAKRVMHAVGNQIGSSFRRLIEGWRRWRGAPELEKLQVPRLAASVLRTLVVYFGGSLLCCLVDKVALLLAAVAIGLLAMKREAWLDAELLRDVGIWVPATFVAVALIRGGFLIHSRRGHWVWSIV